MRTDGSDDDNDAWPDIVSNKTVDFGFFTIPDAPKVDIKLTKIAEPATVKRGATVVYTLTATNESTTDATGVKIEDTLPSGVTLSTSTAPVASIGTFTAGMWDVGTLPANASATLQITVTVD